MAVDGRLRSRPEHRGRDHAGTLSGSPNRLPAPPHCIAVFDAVAHRQAASCRWVLDRVCDDAVMTGIKAGDDGVVVREGLGGIAWNEIRADAPLCQPVDVG